MVVKNPEVLKGQEKTSTLSEAAQRVKACCDKLYPELTANNICQEANDIFANGAPEVEVQTFLAKLDSVVGVFLDKMEKAFSLGEINEGQMSDSKAVAGNFKRNLTQALESMIS